MIYFAAPVSGIRRTSRKRFFQNLDVEGTSADFEDGRAYKSGELDGEFYFHTNKA